MTTNKSRKYQEFNTVLVEAIDESMRELFSPQVLETLYKVLLERHDVTRDELPYRLETVYNILKDIFGKQGGGTISRSIAHRLYEKLGLQSDESLHLELVDYVEVAKNKLVQAAHSNQPTNECTIR